VSSFFFFFEPVQREQEPRFAVATSEQVNRRHAADVIERRAQKLRRAFRRK
jgi:hypothetical protein